MGSLIELGKALNEAITTIGQLFEDMDWAERALNDISRGKRPKAKDDKWRAVVANYEALAKQIETADFISKFDPTRYTYEFQDLMGCHSRPATLAKVNAYISELAQGEAEGVELDNALNGTLTHISATKAALAEILKLYRKLASKPILKEFFQWDWYDLEIKVSPALASLEATVRKRRTRLDGERNRIKTKHSNLVGNVRDITSVECSIEGAWNGVISYPSGRRQNVYHRFTKSGSAYDIVQRFDNGNSFPTCAISISIPSKSVSFSRACSSDVRLNFWFKLSDDYLTMSGQGVRVDLPNQIVSISLSRVGNFSAASDAEPFDPGDEPDLSLEMED